MGTTVGDCPTEGQSSKECVSNTGNEPIESFFGGVSLEGWMGRSVGQ